MVRFMRTTMGFGLTEQILSGEGHMMGGMTMSDDPALQDLMAPMHAMIVARRRPSVSARSRPSR